MPCGTSGPPAVSRATHHEQRKIINTIHRKHAPLFHRIHLVARHARELPVLVRARLFSRHLKGVCSIAACTVAACADRAHVRHGRWVSRQETRRARRGHHCGWCHTRRTPRAPCLTALGRIASRRHGRCAGTRRPRRWRPIHLIRRAHAVRRVGCVRGAVLVVRPRVPVAPVAPAPLGRVTRREGGACVPLHRHTFRMCSGRCMWRAGRPRRGREHLVGRIVRLVRRLVWVIQRGSRIVGVVLATRFRARAHVVPRSFMTTHAALLPRRHVERRPASDALDPCCVT